MNNSAISFGKFCILLATIAFFVWMLQPDNFWEKSTVIILSSTFWLSFWAYCWFRTK